MPTIDTSAQAPYTISAQADTAQCTTTIHNENASLVLVTRPGGYHGTIKTTLTMDTKTPLPGIPLGPPVGVFWCPS